MMWTMDGMTFETTEDMLEHLNRVFWGLVGADAASPLDVEVEEGESLMEVAAEVVAAADLKLQSDQALMQPKTQHELIDIYESFIGIHADKMHNWDWADVSAYRRLAVDSLLLYFLVRSRETIE